MLKGKKIILGISGSIAAYKAAVLTRLLVKAGADVKVILTPAAKEFITPVTLATLSGHTVLMDFFSHDDGSWNSHVDLGVWADVMLVAPATANTLAKMAAGIGDNLLLTTCLSARCPIVIAPAMDLDMWQHPATRNNINTLKTFGNLIIEPVEGELASGLEGKGRMEEPEAIVQWLEQFFKKKSRFNGKQVLITAGPTFENIDPVRFIGNYSSGKMGVALANQLAEEGASVTLILGPVSQEVKSRIRSATGHHGAITVHEVVSAREMWNQANKCFADADIGIMSAAVSDFRPAHPAGEKIRRTGEILHLDLLPNPDIAFELGQTKRPGQILVGFALETGEGVKEALEKKKRKNFDLIVLNTLKHEGAGFGTDTNRITLIGKDNNPREFELKSKNEVARDIADAINELYN